MNISISNCYSQLNTGLMVFPTEIKITTENEKKYNFDKLLACNQYNFLLNTLFDYGLVIRFLEQKNSPHQIFTRDIGFIIENIMFISKMSQLSRQQETQSLIKFAAQYNLRTYQMENYAEGGDVFVQDNNIIIGIGERTTEDAANEIKSVLSATNSSYNIIKAYFDLSLIHLDCAFNILDNNSCIISDGLFNPEEITPLFSTIIKAPLDTNTLGANIINLGNKRILCSCQNLATTLNNSEFCCKYIDYSEVTKVGGGLGCSLLPIQRA
ncbi:arginine deiminase family protein [Proteinivorax tanatarense]|uniref:Arginine deiminase family protein n=1 Tax=Proteinivorax tanatarense TaxID=1260629 RepID=A0AAU7VIX0_9FIRM